MRVGAAVAEHELVELAGLEAQLVRNEGVLAGRAELDGDGDGLLPRQVAAGGGRRGAEAEGQGGDQKRS